MPTLSKWVKAKIYVGTLGAAEAISAISKANPGVVTYGTGGTDPTEDSYVALTDILGMSQVNSRVFRADTVDGTGNTFNLDGLGEDSTLYDTFISGNFQPITWDVNFQTILNPNFSGGAAERLEVSTVHDPVRVYIPGDVEGVVAEMESQWDPSDATLAAVLALSENETLCAMRVDYSTGFKVALLGRFSASLIPSGGRGEVVRTPITFYGAGRVTNFTS